MKFSEQLMYNTVKIIAKDKEGNISTGTGFFMNFNINKENGTSQPVIITNKHVVENSESITVTLCKRDSDNNPLDNEKFSIAINKLKPINHPDYNVDLCAISIANVEELLRQMNTKLYKIPLDTSLLLTDNEMKKSSAIEDVIMVGYPTGIEDTYNNKPIIRKGITATHLKFDYNGKKEFLIDMACFPGSSGSPIFLFNEGTYTIGNGIALGNRCKLLGVLYAGPQYTSVGNIIFQNIPTNPKAVVNIPNNLGLVIKGSRIKELEEWMNGMDKRNKKVVDEL